MALVTSPDIYTNPLSVRGCSICVKEKRKGRKRKEGRIETRGMGYGLGKWLGRGVGAKSKGECLGRGLRAKRKSEELSLGVRARG